MSLQHISTVLIDLIGLSQTFTIKKFHSSNLNVSYERRISYTGTSWLAVTELSRAEFIPVSPHVGPLSGVCDPFSVHFKLNDFLCYTEDCSALVSGLLARVWLSFVLVSPLITDSFVFFLPSVSICHCFLFYFEKVLCFHVQCV